MYSELDSLRITEKLLGFSNKSILTRFLSYFECTVPNPSPLEWKRKCLSLSVCSNKDEEKTHRSKVAYVTAIASLNMMCTRLYVSFVVRMVSKSTTTRDLLIGMLLKGVFVTFMGPQTFVVSLW